jgi:hypothetical protein
MLDLSAYSSDFSGVLDAKTSHLTPYLTRMLAMNKFLLFVLLSIGTTAFAGITKWVDDEGHVHYSDNPPPPNVKAKTLSSSAPDSESASSAPESAPAAPKTLAEKEAELKKAQKTKQEAADKAAKEQGHADALKANCATAQQNLRTLQEGIRLVQVEANGEHSVMDDEQRQKSIARAQQDISANCK